MFNDDAISYDSREQQFSMASTIGSGIGFALNPVNYYLYNPNAWSISKGTMAFSTKMPAAMLRFGGDAVDKIGKAFGHNPLIRKGVRDWASKHAKASALLTGGKLEFGGSFSDVRTRDLITQRNAAKKWNSTLHERRSKAISKLTQMQTDQYKLKANLLRQRKSLVTGFKNSLHPMSQENLYVPKHLRIKDRLAALTRFNKARRNINSQLQGVYKDIRVTRRTLDNVTKNSTSASIISKRELLANVVKRHGTKIAAAGFKTASIIGIASLMWDVASLVGEPVGRAVMNNINEGFSALQNIGRPEGNRLSLSYLSVGAATERQRAISAISRSQLNARSALGNEGALIHQ